MQHKLLRILALFLLLSMIGLAISYDFYETIKVEKYIRLLLKITPMLLCMLYVVLYILFYRITVYSFFMLGNLFLCMLGDIFIGIYDPDIADINNNKMIYLLMGGASFFVGRILLMIIFVIKPYNRISLIRYPYKKLCLSHLLFSLPFIILGILNIIRDPGLISSFIFVYLLTFGFDMSYAYLRIFTSDDLGLESESLIACSFGFIGITLFNISDVLLLICMYTTWLPSYVILISDNIYWIAMFFLTTSVIRSEQEYIEKGSDYFPLNTIS